jgi:hypothetical protein
LLAQPYLGFLHVPGFTHDDYIRMVAQQATQFRAGQALIIHQQRFHRSASTREEISGCALAAAGGTCRGIASVATT